jgi:hypothetical protein
LKRYNNNSNNSNNNSRMARLSVSVPNSKSDKELFQNNASASACEDTVMTTSSSLQSLSPDIYLYSNAHTNTQHHSILKNSSSSSFCVEGRETEELLHDSDDSVDHSPHHPLLRVGSSDRVSFDDDPSAQAQSQPSFRPMYFSTRLVQPLARIFLPNAPASTWIGFVALLLVTCSNFVLSPMRDAVALDIGVQHMPKLTLASTLLAVVSSVPIGWLFEAPDPKRRRLWKRMGLTRGETQGTSLALFYRCFAISLLCYAVGFKLVKWYKTEQTIALGLGITDHGWGRSILTLVGQIMYVAFFLVVHLMKLHSLSLVWGVTTEAMEYEDSARKRQNDTTNSKTRLQRLALVGFGGTLGGILGR